MHLNRKAWLEEESHYPGSCFRVRCSRADMVALYTFSPSNVQQARVPGPDYQRNNPLSGISQFPEQSGPLQPGQGSTFQVLIPKQTTRCKVLVLTSKVPSRSDKICYRVRGFLSRIRADFLANKIPDYSDARVITAGPELQIE